MSSGYGLPNFSTVSDTDVDQLLQQFEDENLLGLKLGSHRAGAETTFEELTPSYLQDEGGGLDKELVSRLAALKAPKTEAGRKVDAAATNVSSSAKSWKHETNAGSKFTEGPSKPNTAAPELGGTLEPNRAPETQGQESSKVNDSLEVDPIDVASLGTDLASRLSKLKGGQSLRGTSQKRAGDTDVSKGELLAAERYDTLQKESSSRTAQGDAGVSGQSSTKVSPPPPLKVPLKVAKASGPPFVDMSRGGGKAHQPVESADGGAAEDSWRIPLAGLFSKRRPSGKTVGVPDAGKSESLGFDDASDLEGAERRAQAILAGVSKPPEEVETGGGKRGFRRPKQRGFDASKVDRKSALFQDLQGVTIPRPEEAYHKVLQEEEKEGLEVEALLAAMHDRVRIEERRGAIASGGAADRLGIGVFEEGDSDLGSEASEEDEGRKVQEVASWALDAARLEGATSESDEDGKVKRKQSHKSFSSSENSSESNGGSSARLGSKQRQGGRFVQKKGVR